MIQEKTVLLQTGRSVKIIAKDLLDTDVPDIEVNVLIKEPSEVHYHTPIYWKLKKLPPQQSRLLQLQYSGLSDKDIRKAIKEFKKDLS